MPARARCEELQQKRATEIRQQRRDKYLKIAFSDIAVRAMQYYPEYRALYQKMHRRAKEPIARTVVAKELARIVYYIITHKTDYKGLKGQPISRQKSLQCPDFVGMASPYA